MTMMDNVKRGPLGLHACLVAARWQPMLTEDFLNVQNVDMS